MDGDGQLTLTGQLGDVMKESAHLAISWLRSNAKRFHLTNGTGGPGMGSRAARVCGVGHCHALQQSTVLCSPPGHQGGGTPPI